MYMIRSSWIPSFFVDSPLCGLMRITSRSESENSFFSHFTNPTSTLVKFMVLYESAMEKHRYVQERLDHNSFDSFPVLLTPLEIEVHAARIYIRKLFVLVQKEIIAGSWLCSIESKTCDELSDVSVISEQKLVPGTIPEVVDEEESTSENVEEELIFYQKDVGWYKVHLFCCFYMYFWF